MVWRGAGVARSDTGREEETLADIVTQDERMRSDDERALIEAANMDPTVRTSAIHAPATSEISGTSAKSYYDTRWPLVNRALELTEQVTHGKAGLIQRAVTYLIIGGSAAVVNLSILAIFFHFGSANVLWYLILANVVAYELSIMANFIPNDYFTFRHLAGHERSWWARCLRFHITSLSGVAVTSILFTLFYHLMGQQAHLALVAQAFAIIIATFYNFTVHHLFTYAHKK
ncbi:MAG: GtrA family protein [Ktedonobacterales bacterium]|jgi:putative flippase GtrA